MSWFWPRGASGSQRDGVVQLVCSSVVRRTRGQPTGGAGIACERCADLQESLLVSYWTLASSRCLCRISLPAFYLFRAAFQSYL